MSLDPAYESWQLADFVLRGDYCPLSSLHSQIEKVRETLGAAFIMHVAVDHEVVLRSLNWADARSGSTSALAYSLCRANYRDEYPELNKSLVDMVRRQSGSRISAIPTATADSLSIRLGELTSRVPHPVRLNSNFLMPESGWGGIMLNHTGRAATAPRDGEVRSILLFHPALTNVRINTVLVDLGVMLKCTFAAAARRDTVVMNRVAQQLSIHGTAQLDFAGVASKALILALDITRSTAGAVYLLSAEDPIVLHCEAQLAYSGHEYRDQIQFAPEESLIARSISRHRTYQHADWIAGASAASELTLGPGSGIELVTPIAGPLADTQEPAIGAITLQKAMGSQGYSSYERALVRNVALRLALIHTSMATRDIATAISTLRSSSPARLQSVHDDATKSGSDDRAWPEDIRIAVRKCQEPLRQLAESTQSHSVSLRIALPDCSVQGHGLALMRVAAYPPRRIDDEFAAQREGDPGPHWEVMHSGREVSVPDTSEDGRYDRVRPDTRSALCVPLRVEGIVAGTLNLESPLVDNYTSFTSIIAAFGGAIGRTLADSRAMLEAEVLDSAAHSLARRHEISGDLNALSSKIESQLSPGGEQVWLTQIESMKAVIEDLREQQPRTSEPSTLWQIFKDCSDKTQLRFSSLRKPSKKVFSEPLTPLATQVLSTVFHSLLRNINYHSSASAYDDEGKAVPRVRFGTTELQGVIQAVIVTENSSKKYVDPKLCRILYRYPVKGPEGELRLGTYIAGLNARRIGARVHACALSHKIFRTTVLVPVGELCDTINR
jgi:hypothetical protein